MATAVAAIAISAVMAFSFAACSDNNNDEPVTPSNTVDIDTVATSASMVVGGYEWGPSVYKVVIGFTGNVGGTLSTSTFKTVKTNSETRTVTGVYLSDSQGDATTGSTSYLAIEMEVGYSGFSATGTPFSYDMYSGFNSWVTSYKVDLTLASDAAITVDGVGVTAGSKVTGLEAINNKIIPETAVFNKDTYTYTGPVASVNSDSETIKLNRAAYEPASAKSDSGKNALVIWLHGAGEGAYGSDDIDIDLLGNEVTALAQDPIQSYFDGGAYILVVQSPTMWMDVDGSLSYNSSSSDGQQSYYTEALMAAIEDYVDSNDDIDTDRIIVGGCSNGGYMTMNLMFEYGDYFAAFYPVCEAYMNSNITDEMIEQVKDYNIWFVQSEDDTTVDPSSCAKPTFLRLIQAGAENVHYTLTEHVIGIDSPSTTYMGHWSWIYVFKDADALHYEFDNSAITSDTTVDYITASNCTKSANFWQWIASIGVSATTYKFEAEDATLYTNPAVDTDTSLGYTDTRAYYTTTVEEESSASSGKSVGCLSYNDNSVTFTINSDVAVEGVTLTVCAASTVAGDFDWSTWSSPMLEVSGSDIGLKVNTADVTLSGTLAGSDSSNYYNWSTVTATIDLVEGDNTIVIYVKDAANAGFNLDYIEVGSDKYEAEDANLYTNPAVETDESLVGFPYYDMRSYYTTTVEEDIESASGNKSVGCFGYEGNTITFTINSTAAESDVQLSLCAASALSTGYFDSSSWTYVTTMSEVDASNITITVNGQSVTLSGTLAGSDEQNYYNWSIVSGTINLNEGVNTIVITMTDPSTANFNVDYISIAAETAVLTWATSVAD